VTPPIDRRLYIKSLNTIFKKNRQFRDIIQDVKTLSSAKSIVEHNLPKNLAQYVTPFAYTNGRLTLSVPNSVILSQVRFYIPELLQLFKNDERFRGLKKIHLKINLTATVSKPSASQNPPISEENRGMLLDTAAAMEDGPLKRALRKLASQHQQL